jgi:hypothetical protein
MAARRPKKVDWDAMERASLARAREDYQRTTPGQRVEEQIELSRELTKLANRALARIRAER